MNTQKKSLVFAYNTDSVNGKQSDLNQVIIANLHQDPSSSWTADGGREEQANVSGMLEFWNVHYCKGQKKKRELDINTHLCGGIQLNC